MAAGSGAAGARSSNAGLEGSLDRRFQGVSNTMESIQGLSNWCIENKKHHSLIVRYWMKWLKKYDAIGTSEEEQSRTPGGGSVLSSTSERTSTRPQTPAEEESTPTPSAITTPQRVVLGKRKRGGDEHLAQQARHHEQSLAQVDRHWQLTMEAAARAREEEMALRREENAQTHAFNLAFLRTLGQVLGGSRRGPSPQEDEPPL
ncbi:uncharacterized protein [Pseudochaenichthys georgianus]|uniref:uncharacterized protein n=1 Tax=Pseudochaenichthys georgianus TaxID=52239 RepID=UPI00146D71B6|nr:uncharacterized protein LOC117460985 [Pseudochaenichthys georgianus]